MHPLADLERALEDARAAVIAAVERAEHSPLPGAVEEYARTTALLFGHLLAEELKDRIALAPPGSAAALVALLDAAVAAAWESLCRRQAR
jgi:hypothetical protein